MSLKMKVKMDGKDAKRFLNQATVEPTKKKFSDNVKMRMKIKDK